MTSRRVSRWPCRGCDQKHTGAEDRGREPGVDLLCVDILQLAVQNELIALGSQADCDCFAEQFEGKDISIFMITGEEELEGVHAICDGGADEGHEMENFGRSMSIVEEHLPYDVQNDGEGDKGGKGQQDNLPEG